MQPAGGGIRYFGFTLAGEAAANVRRDCQYCTNMYSYSTVRPENPPSYGSSDMPDLKSEEDECI